MKTRINGYFCTNPDCNWWASSYYGGFSITWNPDGTIESKSEDYGCPWCGSKTEFKNFVADMWMYNGLRV